MLRPWIVIVAVLALVAGALAWWSSSRVSDGVEPQPAPANAASPVIPETPPDTASPTSTAPEHVATSSAERAAAWVAAYDVATMRSRTEPTLAPTDAFERFCAGSAELAERAAQTAERTRVWIRVLQACAPALRAELAGAAEARARAFAELGERSRDDPALAPLLAELGVGLALDLGFDESERFLQRIARDSAKVELREASRLALGRLWIAAIDRLPDERFAQALVALRELALHAAAPRTAREAADELFAVEHVRVQSPVPDAAAFDTQGALLELAKLRGRVVLLEFSTGGEGTRTLAASRRHLVRELDGEPFELVWVLGPDGDTGELDAREAEWLDNLGRPSPGDLARLGDEHEFFERLARADRERARALAGELALPGRVAVDGGRDGAWARRWCVRRWPSSYVIDAAGKLRYRDLDDAELALALRKLLDEARAAADGAPR